MSSGAITTRTQDRSEASISNTSHTFLLSPPPPPRSKRTLKASPALSARRLRAQSGAGKSNITTPRSPLSPRESFLNILDSPSPTSSETRVVNNKKYTTTPALLTPTLKSAESVRTHIDLGSGLGYSVAIETFSSHYSTENLFAPRTPSAPTAPYRPTKSRSKSFANIPSKINMAIGSILKSSKPPVTDSDSGRKTALGPYPNRSTRMPPTTQPQLPSGRRGSVPNTLFSSSRSGKANPERKELSNQNRKRYPLPLPYSHIVEMDQILGDTRSANNVTSFVNTPRGAGAHERGATGKGPLPYIGADGRLWRDREEELEYKALLKDVDPERRDSGSSAEAEERAKGQWKVFGNGLTGKSGYHVVLTPNTPGSAGTTSSSNASYDHEYSPASPDVLQGHHHHFPSYSFPSTQPRAFQFPSSTHDFSIDPEPSYSNTPPVPRERRRPSPLPALTDGLVPPPPAAPVHRSTTPAHVTPTVTHPAHAKADFLASSFHPPTTTTLEPRVERKDGTNSKPPTSGSRKVTPPGIAIGRRSSIGYSGHEYSPSSRSSSRADSSSEKKLEKSSNSFLSNVFSKKGSKA